MAKKKSTKKSVEDKHQEDTLIDMSNAAVKKLLKNAKSEGFVNYKDINKVVNAEKYTSEQIEDLMSSISEMGISIIEAEADDQDESQSDTKLDNEKSKKKTSTDRTDDPVRMYLREMGTVDLLSREGEIAIAKRIEAGKEAMIEGLCESPLTFQAIIIWRDELNEGKVLLRDIIDLDATFAGPDAKKIDRSAEGAAPPPSGAPSGEAEGEPDEDDDDDESNLSLSAKEMELKPKVLASFNVIASTYKKLRRLQDQSVELQADNKELSRAQQNRADKLRSEIIAEVKELSLNNSRIEALVEQLYSINKSLVGLELRLWRMAD